MSSSTGSIPEEDGGKLYNTCTVFGPDGEMILKHRKVCVGHIQGVVSWRDESSSSFFFPPLRFTCLTSTFPEKSASRNLRRWARGTVYRCLTHVSDSRGLWLSASQSGWASHWSDVFLLQRSAKWVLGSAMTWGLRSSPSSTAERVSVWKVFGFCFPVMYQSWLDCAFVLRLSAAGLPRSLQHDHRPRPLGAPAEGEVRLRVIVSHSQKE